MQNLNPTNHHPRHLPDFLCIGAKKAGTTWLYDNLRQHPNVWLPPIKELHYFDRNSERPQIFSTFRSTEDGRRARYALRQGGAPTIWFVRFLCYVRNEAWYRSLFMPKAGQICGEIATAYATMTEDRISCVKRSLPNAKVLYILRDPVERAWSNLKMRVEKYLGTHVEALSEREAIQIVESRWHAFTADGDYLGNLARWQQQYSHEQIFLGFFDQIEVDPVEFFKSTLTFLQLTSTDEIIPSEITVPRNKHGERTIPPVIRYHITERLYPQFEALHHHFDNAYTSKWLQNAIVTLNATRTR